MIFEKPLKGDVRVVHACDVNLHSAQGYALIGVVYEDTPMPVSYEVPHPLGGKETCYIDRIERKAAFIMEMDYDTLLANLQQENKNLKAEVKDFKDTCRKQEEELRELRVQDEHADARITQLKKDRNELFENLKEREVVMKQMEENLGKIQGFLGTREYNRILDEE